MNLIPPTITRAFGRAFGHAMSARVSADDIQHDRHYCCVRGHIVRYSQLSVVQHTRLHAGQAMFCEREGHIKLSELFRTVAPWPDKTLATDDDHEGGAL